jgi:hypothetical protein
MQKSAINQGVRMNKPHIQLLTVTMSCLALFCIPTRALAQVCDSGRPYGDALDFDSENGLWYDWDSGTYYFDNTGNCVDGDASWGYDDLDDWLAFSDWNGEDQWWAGHVLESACDQGFSSECVPNPTLQCGPGYSVRMLVRTSDNYIADQWCTPTVSPPTVPVAQEVDAWFDVAGRFFEWVLGIGPAYTEYKEGSLQTAQMQQAPGIPGARAYFLWVNRNHISYENCQNLESVFGYTVTFGLKGLLDAGGNANQQFVGAYAVNIEPGEFVGMARFTIYNVTSMNSFLYHAPGVDKYSRSVFPYGGNTYQTFTWEEQVCHQEG